MTHAEKYANENYIFRAYLGNDVYIEVMDVSNRECRTELLTRYFNEADDSKAKAFGYRWRKLCGKGIFVKSLNRVAIDGHYPSLSIHDPVTHKQRRVYLIDFK